MREAARGGSTGTKIVRESKGVINHTLLELYRADTMRGVGRKALQDPPTSRRTCKLTLCRITKFTHTSDAMCAGTAGLGKQASQARIMTMSLSQYTKFAHTW